MRIHPAEPRTVHPLWVRLVATFGLMVFLIASTVQAGHLHGNWPPRHGEQRVTSSEWAPLPDSDAACPLCIAMHSAMPSDIKSSTESLVQIEEIAVAVGVHLAQRPMFFSLFSRPPPQA